MAANAERNISELRNMECLPTKKNRTQIPRIKNLIILRTIKINSIFVVAN